VRHGACGERVDASKEASGKVLLGGILLRGSVSGATRGVVVRGGVKVWE
jgi:hypothetical protein